MAPLEMTDFSVPTAPDHLGDYLNAFRAGQALAAPVASPLDQLTNAVSGRLAISTDAQREQAARRADILAALGSGLSAVPYPQRTSILAHIAPALESEGIPAEAVRNFDPTDEALALSIDQAQAAAELLKTS